MWPGGKRQGGGVCFGGKKEQQTKGPRKGGRSFFKIKKKRRKRTWMHLKANRRSVDHWMIYWRSTGTISRKIY